MWFIDKNSPHQWISYRIRKKVVSVRTPFQYVEILDTHEFGRMVILDGLIQSSESDECIYHEILVHPAMIAHPRPKHILILGAGEGATLREVLRHSTVERAVMIDIDREFVDLCKRFLRKWHRGSFRDARSVLIFEDAFSYLQKTADRFDVIIADISDPADTGPARFIYTAKFYSLISRALKPGGIFVTHATAVHYAPRRNYSYVILTQLRRIFPEVSVSYEFIPSFASLWSFATGSFTRRPQQVPAERIRRRLQRRGIEGLSYYSPETHRRLFIIPPCLRRNMPAGRGDM